MDKKPIIKRVRVIIEVDVPNELRLSKTSITEAAKNIAAYVHGDVVYVATEELSDSWKQGRESIG